MNSSPQPPLQSPLPDEEAYPHWERNRWVMALATFFHTTGFGVITPFFPLVLQELGATGRLEVWVGYAMGSYFTLSFFLMPIWGVVADHYGRKLMALRTSLGMAFIFFLLPLTPTLYWFLAVFLILGTTNGFIPASNALIATNTPPKAMGRSLTMVQTGTLIGASLGPTVGALIASWLPAYSYLYWVSAALLFCGGMLTLFLAREKHQRPDTPFRLHMVQDFKVIRKLPNIGGLMYITFINTFSFIGGITIISVYTLDLLKEGGITEGSDVNFWVGAVALAFTVSSALSVRIWGRFQDRFGPSRILAVSLLAGYLASLPIPLVQSPLQLVISRFIMGFVIIGAGSSTVTMIKSYSPKGMEARVLAYSSAFGALGIGAGPMMAGLIGPVLGLRVFFLVNSALLLVGFGVWMRAHLRGAEGEAEAE